MSIPGLGQIPSEQPSASSTRAIALNPGWEWRFDIPPGGTLSVKLLSGTAEKDGVELAPRNAYTLPSAKSRILTWHGCELEVEGRTATDSVAQYATPAANPANAYVNLHAHLERLRGEAAAENKEGPRLMVAGPASSGRTTLARTLASYATRQGRQPLVVNTDTRDGMLTLPGTVSAAVLATVLDPQAPDGWGGTPTSGPSSVPVKLPLVFFHGMESAEEEPETYRGLVSRLAGTASGRLSEDKDVRASGVIVDTLRVSAGSQVGADLLAHIVDELSVNIIIVLGSPELAAELTRRFATEKTTLGEPIDVLALDRPDGVVSKSQDFEQHAREAVIKDYFFGDARRTLSPQIQQIEFDSVVIYKILDAVYEYVKYVLVNPEDWADTTDVPLTLDTNGGEPGTPTRTEPSQEMQHWTLAVMHASNRDSPDTVRNAGVMGFVYVADVDEERRKIKLLAPVGGRLGDKPLVWGRWPEPFINLLG